MEDYIVFKTLQQSVDVCYLKKNPNTLYVLKHNKINKDAISFHNKRLVVTPGNEQAVLNELKILQLIKRNGGHMNILPLHRHFIQDGRITFVFEYAKDGDVLSMLLETSSPFNNPKMAMKIMIDIVGAVAFLHDLEVAHRDISLENIVLHENKFKLIDFGLACYKNKGGDAIVGKQFYIAPEVWQMDLHMDCFAADIWSLGIVFFILLTGKPLFPKATKESDQFNAVLKYGMECVLKQSGVDQNCIELLCEMLVIDPSNRAPAHKVLEAITKLTCPPAQEKK